MSRGGCTQQLAFCSAVRVTLVGGDHAGDNQVLVLAGAGVVAVALVVGLAHLLHDDAALDTRIVADLADGSCIAR